MYYYLNTLNELHKILKCWVFMELLLSNFFIYKIVFKMYSFQNKTRFLNVPLCLRPLFSIHILFCLLIWHIGSFSNILFPCICSSVTYFYFWFYIILRVFFINISFIHLFIQSLMLSASRHGYTSNLCKNRCTVCLLSIKWEFASVKYISYVI